MMRYWKAPVSLMIWKLERKYNIPIAVIKHGSALGRQLNVGSSAGVIDIHPHDVENFKNGNLIMPVPINTGTPAIYIIDAAIRNKKHLSDVDVILRHEIGHVLTRHETTTEMLADSEARKILLNDVGKICHRYDLVNMAHWNHPVEKIANDRMGIDPIDMKCAFYGDANVDDWKLHPSYNVLHIDIPKHIMAMFIRFIQRGIVQFSAFEYYRWINWYDSILCQIYTGQSRYLAQYLVDMARNEFMYDHPEFD